MPKCMECAYCECARGIDEQHFEVSCFRKKRIKMNGKLKDFDDPGIEIDCIDFYKRIPNITSKEAFDIQREEKLKGKEFAYTEKALNLSKEANAIAKDSKVWAIIAVIISVVAIALSTMFWKW